MRKLTLEQWQTLAQGLHREVARVAPEWTDFNLHDPGVTTLELLTYALDDLHARKNSLDERAHVLAHQVAEHARSLARQRADADCPPGPRRLRYFSGALLGADDLATEQEYFRGRLARHNRLLHGAGVVTGLQVTVENVGGRQQAIVAPGFALDPNGEEIEVGAPERVDLPPQGKEVLVLLRYEERPCRLVAAVGDSMTAAHSRVVEMFSIALSPADDPTAIALARLKRSRGRWTRDPRHRPVRIRR